MGEIVTLRDGQDLRDWKCTFVAVVVSLCPDINPDAADEASDTEFCLEIDPSLAASMWVEQQGLPPPSHIDAHRAGEPHLCGATAPVARAVRASPVSEEAGPGSSNRLGTFARTVRHLS